MSDKLTHRGWFGVCPCYFGDLDSDAPLVEPRHWLLAPLLMLSQALYDLAFIVCSAVNAEFEAAWPLVVTGKLSQPKDLPL